MYAGVDVDGVRNEKRHFGVAFCLSYVLCKEQRCLRLHVMMALEGLVFVLLCVMLHFSWIVDAKRIRK